MQPETRTGLPLVSLITYWILITCYCPHLGDPSTCRPLPPNQRRSCDHRADPLSATFKSWAFMSPGVFHARISLAPPFESAPSQRQHRWVDWPACPLLANCGVPSSSSAIVPPFTHLHLSAHRCCLWKLPSSPPPTSCWGYAQENQEAINLSHGFADTLVAESLGVRELNSVGPLSKMPDAKGRHTLTPMAILHPGREGRSLANPLEAPAKRPSIAENPDPMLIRRSPNKILSTTKRRISLFCPQCGARTLVSETRGPFRDRRCTNAACRLAFTTSENVLTLRERRLCARTRAVHGKVSLATSVAGRAQPRNLPEVGAGTEYVEISNAAPAAPKCAQAGVA
jgi:hypothetical protein